LEKLSVWERLEAGAHLVVNVSGGKDSDCMALMLSQLRQRCAWPGRFILLHQDVGRMEWPQSEPHCQALADRVNAEYFVVRREQGDLLERIWQRALTLQGTGKPPWPSSETRYCTSELKTGIANRWTRNAFPDNAIVIHALGIRADESASRAKKAEWSDRPTASAATKSRHVYTWLPIHSYGLSDVWATLKRHHWEPHPAYALGNERVSCALCVLASQNDLAVGAAQNPEIYNELVEIEIYCGFAFQQGRWLGDLRPDLLTPERLARFRAMRQAQTNQPPLL
jgi:3'-phosphoadenosine 5'-phosphosulfate sulfotransferase (PAPS reductase)/FAD synthetase